MVIPGFNPGGLELEIFAFVEYSRFHWRHVPLSYICQQVLVMEKRKGGGDGGKIRNKMRLIYINGHFQPYATDTEENCVVWQN